MNKQILVIALTAACGAIACSATAFAGQAAAAPADTLAAQSAPNTAAPTKKAERAVPAPGDRNCVRSTGSHIPPPKGQCLPVNGRSYSQKDIQRTGTNNIGRALQMLDPSIQVRGH